MKPFVLVVEDDPSLGQTLCEVLSTKGFEVTVVHDGEEALDTLAHSPIPSLVVLDLVLPRFDGWNLLKVLNGMAAIPILVMSALPERDRDLAKGATDFLPKPFSIDDFMSRVDLLCPLPRPPRPHLTPVH